MTSYLNHSDTELAALLSTGDKDAFESIYRRYGSGLYRYARKNITVKEDCEEIIQEVFESLWARRESLGNVTALGAYLYQIVKYKVIRYFALKLRITEKLSNSDIAKRMNIKKSTVENYMVTALAYFRAAYQNLAS